MANQPGAEANQKIDNCIEGARQAGLYPGRCVGLIADPCINSAKDKDRAADKAKECAAQELKYSGCPGPQVPGRDQAGGCGYKPYRGESPKGMGPGR